jgi:hypothetical protein
VTTLAERAACQINLNYGAGVCDAASRRHGRIAAFDERGRRIARLHEDADAVGGDLVRGAATRGDEPFHGGIGFCGRGEWG